MNDDRPQFDQQFRDMSAQDFLSMGVGQLAYVKAVTLDDGQGFAIHAANGARLAVLATYEAAVMAARQNDMEPVQLQ